MTAVTYLLRRVLVISLMAIPSVHAVDTCSAVFDREMSAIEILTPDLTTGQRSAAAYFLHFSSLKKLIKVYDQIRKGGVPGENIFDQFVNGLGVKVRHDPSKLALIPPTGSLVISSNHPYGGLDGIILMSLLLKVRPDVKILATSLLTRIPELAEGIIPVPFGNSREAREGRKNALDSALKHVKNGGALVVFPAGGVAQATHWGWGRAIDSEWRPGAARILTKTNATLVSAYFPGQNSRFFQVMGEIPGFRPSFLGREIVNKRGQDIEVRLAEPLSRDWRKDFANLDELTRAMRTATDQLESRSH